ncbi:hypothetical protein [Actinomadura alba]|uniref:Catalytic LigB subunit of aromatic ring-opening dioxygenase n=1 Tax=Actinomadura alba TaxID=406431 RepID=A0ABR7LHR2_9ACTN|nr:hypothetical protein [Actinomadura alba]MBC6464037.1 hypothetical protein [Actinomadura alba]
MLIGAAVCAHPPVLVPEVASGAAAELGELRAACDEAVRRLVAPGGLDLLVVVGGDAETRTYGADAAGSLRRYGLDLMFGAGLPRLPLSLTIGRWLLTRAGILHADADAGADADAATRRVGGLGGAAVGTVRFQSVDWDAAPAECLRLGRELAESAQRVGLLVMGDGSACRTEKAPGYLDERAEDYDDGVARALGGAEITALARLDPEISRELRVAGRAAWQVLAGAAGDGRFAAELLAAEAPYGVGYFAASWRRDQADRPPG